VYVTHDQIEAMTMGHRITVMRAGKIQQVGTPREVYENPANAFVAQFIGTPPMNLLPMTVGDSMLRASSFALPMRIPLAEGRRVIAGIRPEHIVLATNGNSIPAKVDLVEPIGHESIVYATAGSEKLVAIFEPHEAPNAGDMVSLSVDPARVHLFDAESEESLTAGTGRGWTREELYDRGGTG
jgi:multiple sugar transport system ATP-binding protein